VDLWVIAFGLFRFSGSYEISGKFFLIENGY